MKIYTNYYKKLKKNTLLEAEEPDEELEGEETEEIEEDDFTEDEEPTEVEDIPGDDDDKEPETEEEKKLTTRQLINKTSTTLHYLLNDLDKILKDSGNTDTEHDSFDVCLQECEEFLTWLKIPEMEKHNKLVYKINHFGIANENNFEELLLTAHEYFSNFKSLLEEVKKYPCWSTIITPAKFEAIEKATITILPELEKSQTDNFTTFMGLWNSTIEKEFKVLAEMIAQILEDREQKTKELLDELNHIYGNKKAFVKIRDWIRDVERDFKNSFKQLHWPRKTIVSFKHRIEEIYNYLEEEILTNSIFNTKFSANLKNKNLNDWNTELKETNDQLKKIVSDVSKLAKRFMKKQEREKTDKWHDAFQRAVKREINGQEGAIQSTWTNYFTKEFPYMNRKVLGTLGDAFATEVRELGFTVLYNPFIAYLKYMGGKPKFKQNIVDHPGDYVEIHNAVANNILTGNDLFGLGYFKRKNIIFSPDFYTKPVWEAERYLKAQKQVERLLNKNDAANFQHKHLTDRYDNEKDRAQGRQNFFIDLFYEPGNIDSGPLVGRKAGDPNGKLQPISRIENNLTKCFTQQDLGLEADAEDWEEKVKVITSDNLNKALTAIKKKAQAADPYDVDRLVHKWLDSLNYEPEDWKTKPPTEVKDIVHDAGWRFPTKAEAGSSTNYENIRAKIQAELNQVKEREERKRDKV